MEDRAKEVEDFFKSESEESENESEKPTSLIPSSEQETPQPTPVVNCLELKEELSRATDTLSVSAFVDPTEEISTTNLVDIEKTKSPTAESSVNSQFAHQEDGETKSQDLHSTALEDNNENGIANKVVLDLKNEIPKESTALISDDSNDSLFEYSSVFSHKEKVENIKRLSIARVNKPTLHGRPGQLLDLDAEATTPDQKSKVDNLIERFVQQVTSTKKSPQKKDVQIR